MDVFLGIFLRALFYRSCLRSVSPDLDVLLFLDMLVLETYNVLHTPFIKIIFFKIVVQLKILATAPGKLAYESFFDEEKNGVINKWLFTSQGIFIMVFFSL